MRIAAVIVALLLLAGGVDATRGWLIALTVLTGLGMLRLRPWRPLAFTPHVDVRMASFVLASLLLAGTVEANRDWLIVMAAVTGVAAFCPRIVALDRFGQRDRGRRRDKWRRGRHRWDWQWDWTGDDWR
ncbi:MAG TPA: hypothetical protein VNM91_03685 [Dehalococcoidia bacterium]|nr:hypothetical protein [Dehalococcoidia bacterium]